MAPQARSSGPAAQASPPRDEPGVSPVLAPLGGEGVHDLERTPGERRRIYVGLRLKLLLVLAISLAWAGLSLWIALPWIEDLGESITLPLAAAVIAGIAIIPGYLNANLIASLLIDRPPPLRFDLDFPELTVVVACFNEEETIEETLDYVGKQKYPGGLRILVADDGSKTAPPSWRTSVRGGAPADLRRDPCRTAARPGP